MGAVLITLRPVVSILKEKYDPVTNSIDLFVYRTFIHFTSIWDFKMKR